MGLLLTWQQQVKATEVTNIQKQIAAINSFKQKENEAITKTIALIINQTIECPISDMKKLKSMEQARISSLVAITSYNSGLNISQNKKTKRIIESIIMKLSSRVLKFSKCRLNECFSPHLFRIRALLNRTSELKRPEAA